MYKAIRNTAIAVMATLFSISAAQAEEIKPYAGIGLGAFSINNTIAGVDSSDWTFGGFGILGADITENIALELRGGATGQATVFGTKDKLSYFFSYLAKIQMPTTDALSIYGLIGGTTANYKSTAAIDVSKTSISFGGGINIKMDDNLSLGAEWVRYWHNVTVVTGLEADADGLSATLKYSF